jgi:hypothetical protein
VHEPRGKRVHGSESRLEFNRRQKYVRDSERSFMMLLRSLKRRGVKGLPASVPPGRDPELPVLIGGTACL